MSKVDLVHFMINGTSLNGISLNDPVKKVIDTMGKPIETIGNKETGFFQYRNGLRYGYFENEIDELAILFRPQKKYWYSVKNDLNEEIIISGKTQIHQFIYMLKSTEVKFACVDEKNLDKDTLMLKVNGAVYVFFDLYTGYLEKIFVARK